MSLNELILALNNNPDAVNNALAEEGKKQAARNPANATDQGDFTSGYVIVIPGVGPVHGVVRTAYVDCYTLSCDGDVVMTSGQRADISRMFDGLEQFSFTNCSNSDKEMLTHHPSLKTVIQMGLVAPNMDNLVSSVNVRCVADKTGSAVLLQMIRDLSAAAVQSKTSPGHVAPIVGIDTGRTTLDRRLLSKEGQKVVSKQPSARPLFQSGSNNDAVRCLTDSRFKSIQGDIIMAADVDLLLRDNPFADGTKVYAALAFNPGDFKDGAVEDLPARAKKFLIAIYAAIAGFSRTGAGDTAGTVTVRGNVVIFCGTWRTKNYLRRKQKPGIAATLFRDLITGLKRFHQASFTCQQNHVRSQLQQLYAERSMLHDGKDLKRFLGEKDKAVKQTGLSGKAKKTGKDRDIRLLEYDHYEQGEEKFDSDGDEEMTHATTADGDFINAEDLDEAWEGTGPTKAQKRKCTGATLPDVPRGDV